MTPRLILCLCMLCSTALLQEARAEQILPNDRLLREARDAGRNNAWVRAYGLLQAYVQRDPPEMSSSSYRRSILTAMNAAYSNANIAAGAAAGFDGKGDSAGSSTGKGAKPKAFALPSKPKSPKSYRLRCQGGGRMNANYSVNGGRVEVRIHFGKAPKAANKAKPGAGRCARLDRPLKKADPVQILWRASSRAAHISYISFGAPDWSASRGLKPGKGKLASLVGDVRGGTLKKLIASVLKDKIFDVACYDNGRGSCVVTKVY